MITITATPASAASGKKVIVTLSNNYIADANTYELTFNDKGIAVLELSTKLPGDVTIDFAVDNTTLKATTKVIVSSSAEGMSECEVNGHTYRTNIIYGSCVENGTKYFECSVCGFSYSETVIATGHIFNEGESKCSNCDYNKADDCSCKCHKTGFFAKIIWKITIFFNKILRRNKVCSCGIYHY